ncbi:MAG: hypothetical protein ACK4R6_06660 [Spirosomataceae bacterium]
MKKNVKLAETSLKEDQIKNSVLPIAETYSTINGRTITFEELILSPNVSFRTAKS